MTEFKRNMSEDKTPEELYRQYQTLRDDIPPAVYASLKAAAEHGVHKDNIDVILERAKTHETEQKAPSRPSGQIIQPNSNSLFSLVKTWFGGINSMPGTAFASITLAVIAIPIALNFLGQSTPTEQLAYFDDCSACADYIQNAAVSTRSTTPGFVNLQPRQRYDARLGRIYADLKILRSIGSEENQEILKTQAKRLRALPASFHGPQLLQIINKPKANYQQLLAAIQSDQTLAPASLAFLAAESLEIANITARRAQGNADLEEVTASFNNALQQFQQLTNSVAFENNTLAQNTLNELSRFSESNLDQADAVALTKLVGLYTQALQSLGI